MDFCTSCNIPPLPITQAPLGRFVAELAQDGLAQKILKAYLSAVRYMQLTTLGTDSNIRDMGNLAYVLQGIRRSQAISGTNRPRTRLPITAAIMRSLKGSWEMQGITIDRLMLWATACTCFFGLLRSGEAMVPTQSAYDPAVQLSISDLSLNSATSPSHIIVRIKASKTDPFRSGMSIFLGRTDKDLCPVAVMLSYVHCRGLNPGPPFHFADGCPLSREAFVREIRSALERVGTSYSGHSFRIGAATTAGVEDAVIKILGRWESTAYLQYVQLPRESLASRLSNRHNTTDRTIPPTQR